MSTSAGEQVDCEGLKRQVFFVSVPDVRYSN